MSSSKKQSLLVIGIAMLIIAGILLYFALSQPKIYVDANGSTSAESSYQTTASNSIKSDNTVSVTFPVNINTCTVEDLMAIDNIGQAKASAIIEYREYLGGYTSVEQIKNIEGIGDKIYESISPYLCV